MQSKPKSLPFAEIERRLTKIGYQIADAQDGILVFWQIRPPYFPNAVARKVAYPFPAFYRDLPLVPAALVDDLILHLFLTGDEDEQFWNDEGTIH